ncbi:helix-turn-helix transcriptional regulator [Leucobacter viscericola]|uniref:Helix-turn-helix transcriptional regulator n=1 Tax=Leucobacter viscericola TaxID=2714935 RepID=A0A6G7XIZ1_9MICO|nr:helix-turn-helix transcriptional regulator [Leucobacter viscericola]QIK64482.1 helix-turn-helix transcriptional regulator [Leucobacter viscericola]
MNLNDPVGALEELDRAIESGHPETIARVAAANIWPLLTSHMERLTAAVSDLDSALLERHPTLRLVHPMMAILARTSRTFKTVAFTEDARRMSPEEVDFLILAQNIASRASGDTGAAILYAKRLKDRLQHTSVAARDRLDGPLWFFHHQIGSTMLIAGDSSGALLEFATARQLGKLSMQPYAERMALGRVALAHAVRGALGDAERVLRELEGLPAPVFAHHNATASTENTAAALIAVDRVADNLDERLMKLEPHDSIEMIWPFALLARTRAFILRQEPEDALEAVRLTEDSHPVQPGSFAYDVIGAGTIEALLATGELAYARRVADKRSQVGVFTRLAMARLSLQEGRLELAARDLQAIAHETALGPAQRAESAVLTAWLDLARSDDIDSETAMHVLRVARNPDNRRIVSIMPRQLVEKVLERLPGDSKEVFDDLTEGAERFEMSHRPVLTDSELRVLNALVGNDSTSGIATLFHVSPNTIKSQLRSIYRKLGCSSRGEAIRIATRMHLLLASESH